MINDILSELSREMDATVDSLKHDLARVRTGRANPSLLDGVVVNYYGTDTPLNKLATVSAPEAQMLVVQPFDQGIVADIEKAIRKANLGLSAVNDGKILRVPIPALTEERRKEMVKQVRRESENHRVSARTHRREANETLKELLAEKEISEDDMHKAQDVVQKLTDDVTKRIEEVVKAKEEEVMAV